MARGIKFVFSSALVCVCLLASCAGEDGPASVFHRTCSRCHDLDTALRQDFDRDMWDAVVRRMSEFAAPRYGPITEADRKVIVDYLSNRPVK